MDELRAWIKELAEVVFWGNEWATIEACVKELAEVGSWGKGLSEVGAWGKFELVEIGDWNVDYAGIVKHFLFTMTAYS